MIIFDGFKLIDLAIMAGMLIISGILILIGIIEEKIKGRRK